MNYDDWKLSNPIDDGCSYEMVSNCCGAQIWEDTDICGQCKEHCESIEDYEYRQIELENHLERKAEAKRKYNE